MNIQNKKLSQAYEAVKNDTSSGSSEIADNSLKAVAAAAYYFSKKNDLGGFTEYANALMNAKPSMAAPKNLVKHILGQINSLDDLKRMNQLKNETLALVDKARKEAIQKAYGEIILRRGFKKIATVSYSSSVARFIRNLKWAESPIIFAAESNWRGNSFGRKIADTAVAMDIACEVIPDNSLDLLAEKSDCLLMGADKVINNQGIINGAPGKHAAEIFSGSKPVFVLADSLKMDDSQELEEGFEFIGRNLIDEIFTDSNFEGN